MNKVWDLESTEHECNLALILALKIIQFLIELVDEI